MFTLFDVWLVNFVIGCGCAIVYALVNDGTFRRTADQDIELCNNGYKKNCRKCKYFNIEDDSCRHSLLQEVADLYSYEDGKEWHVKDVQKAICKFKYSYELGLLSKADYDKISRLIDICEAETGMSHHYASYTPVSFNVNNKLLFDELRSHIH